MGSPETDTLRAFIKKYPKGRFTGEAANRLAALDDRAAKTLAPKQPSRVGKALRDIMGLLFVVAWTIGSLSLFAQRDGAIFGLLGLAALAAFFYFGWARSKQQL